MPNAVLYRTVSDDHICPFGIKSKALLSRQGYSVTDNQLSSRAETEAFKTEHNVKTTPQTFIGGERIGGYEDLRRFFGLNVKDPDQTSYVPVIVVFIIAALMALAAQFSILESLAPLRAFEWFIAFSMTLLAMLKLRDLDSFTNMFVGYDLLARRAVRYAYIYPFAEAASGVLMIAGGIYGVIAAPIALFIGSIGAVSVFKAVYIDKRDLKCACVGGNSNVPLGFVSLTENLMMMAMGIWMLIKFF